MNVVMRFAAVIAAGLAVATPATAAPLRWTFNNLFLDNGASVVGSFDYDATSNSFTNINIVASGGTGPMNQTTVFGTIGALGVYSDATQGLFMPVGYAGGSLAGLEFLYIQHPAAARSNAGGFVDFSEFGVASWGFCGDAACDTFAAGTPRTSALEPAGTITAGAVPEPASWAMLIAGFGLVGAASRRRRSLAQA